MAKENSIYDEEYACDELDCTCDDSKMCLALKIGIGVAAVAILGSVITYTIIKKRKNN